MATKRNAATPTGTYPFERDTTHAGRMARIAGRQGQFKVVAHETNPRNGASWWLLFGPWTAGDHGQATHVREIQLVPEPRRRKQTGDTDA